MAIALPFILFLFGAANLVFAFMPVPFALTGIVSMHNQRKMRWLLASVPEEARDRVGRLVVGGIFTVASLGMLLRA